MAAKILDGLEKLVTRLSLQCPAGAQSIPQGQNDLWEDFVSCGFITGQILSCRSNYMYGVLYNHGLTTPGSINKEIG